MNKINDVLISMMRRYFKEISVYFFVIVFISPQTGTADPFTFVVAADMRNYSGWGTYDTPNYFRGVCETISALGAGSFMVCPGDIDPTVYVNWTIEQYLGSNYIRYPVVGNHELPGDGNEEYYGANMAWLRSYDYDQNGTGVPPDIVNTGPSGCEETTFSFDYENAHFVVLNQYYDGNSDIGTDGDVVDALYNWLAADLATTTKQHIFVIGHEPAYPQPDAYNGRLRHQDDSLNKYPQNRDRFWNLLRNEGVVAYICGHTHNYSAVNIDGVFQLDAGHARGAGDTGAPSTFLIINVEGDLVTMNAYRDIHDGIYDYDDIIEDVALPVGMSTFTICQEGNAVKLEWKTESEISNLGFIIERREEGATTWREIASYISHTELKGQGTVSYQTIYKFYDNSVQTGFIYEYRLADVSYNGIIEYHGIQRITVKQNYERNFAGHINLMTVFPNPFNLTTTIEFNLSKTRKATLKIFNILGEEVATLASGSLSAGSYSYEWDASDLASGVYLYCLETEGYVKTKKIILMK